MKRVIITGGNGYIGSALIRRLLQDGVEVHAIANANHQRLSLLLPSECVHVLTEGMDQAADLVIRHQPDTIFHLAAVYSEPHSVGCIESMIDGNLVLGATLLFAATRCSIPPAFINTGTYWQFAEDGSYAPNTLYAATKHAFQDILHYYVNVHALPGTTLVLYDVFGENDDRPKLWNQLVKAEKDTHIPLSSGSQQIYLVQIQDILDAFIHAAKQLHTGDLRGTLYSVRSTHSFTLRQLVEDFNQASGLNLQLGWGERPVWSSVVQNPWAGELLPGWSPKRDILASLLALMDQHSQVI